MSTPLTEECRLATWTSTSSPRASTSGPTRGGGKIRSCRQRTWWIEGGVIQVFSSPRSFHQNAASNLHIADTTSHGLAASGGERSARETPLVDRTADGVDEGNDPIEDPEGDSQIMLLGRIFEFDSPLIFEASPLRHRSQSSVGELRLSKPGNETEEGGTERWEKVIQHPFELIVRGVLKYQLPLSSRVRTASIRASVIVHPDEGVEMGNMRTSETHTPYPAGSDMVVRRGARYGVRAIGFVA